MKTYDESLDFLFEDIFFAEIESWFTADIVCCDKCYDSFISKWPLLESRDKGFYSIETSVFYEGSKKLRQCYSKEKYLALLADILCPRCESSIEKGFSFCNFKDLFEEEDDFHGLQDLIVKTPFMVLENSLAKRVYNILKTIHNQNKKNSINTVLYRGRILKDNVSKEEFLPPPSKYVNEGRYNHIGMPVFYLANQIETCFKELREPNNNFYVAEIRIDKELNLLDLRNIEEIYNDDILKAIIISAILSSKANDDCKFKPEYFFSRFIADCCKYIGFDGIIYPSIQCNKGDNYVLFNTDIITIESVIKYESNSLF